MEDSGITHCLFRRFRYCPSLLAFYMEEIMCLPVSNDFQVSCKDKAVETDMLEFLYETCKEKYDLESNSEVRKLWSVLRLDLTNIIDESDGGTDVE